MDSALGPGLRGSHPHSQVCVRSRDKESHCPGRQCGQRLAPRSLQTGFHPVARADQAESRSVTCDVRLEARGQSGVPRQWLSSGSGGRAGQQQLRETGVAGARACQTVAWWGWGQCQGPAGSLQGRSVPLLGVMPMAVAPGDGGGELPRRLHSQVRPPHPQGRAEVWAPGHRASPKPRPWHVPGSTLPRWAASGVAEPGLGCWPGVLAVHACVTRPRGSRLGGQPCGHTFLLSPSTAVA